MTNTGSKQAEDVVVENEAFSRVEVRAGFGARQGKGGRPAHHL